MKKILIFPGVILAVVLLSGCGNQVDKPMEPQMPSAATEQAKNALAPAVAPPASVSIEPGATPDEEIENIDKDLQSIDDSSFDQNSLSNASVGL